VCCSTSCSSLWKGKTQWLSARDVYVPWLFTEGNPEGLWRRTGACLHMSAAAGLGPEIQAMLSSLEEP
jgi:hypothetical protein